MSRWLLAALLMTGVHFAASYLVPLDRPSQGAFGGLLRWAWPWAQGDHGPLGTMSAAGFPVIGFFMAVGGGGLLALAALGVAGWWVPAGWWRPLAVTGAVLLLVLLALFLSPTKLLPMACAIAIAWIAWTGRWSPAA